MENSFFEYRNDTADKIGSDSEDIINNSGMIDESFTTMRKPPPSAQKNGTVFIPESDDAESDDATESYDEEDIQNMSKLVTRRSSVALSHVISSSDEDVSKRGSISRQFEHSSTKVVLSSSSDEEEVSPEIVPRRRPPLRQRTSVNSKSSDSPIIRRVKRRMVLYDSETDNSIIVDNDRTKMICLKDTPAKIDNGDEVTDNIEPKNMSFNDSNVVGSNDDEGVDDEEFGPDEDEMVMCKATRMSIMGIRPKDAESDESDFIVSDESNFKSRSSNSISGSVSSLNELPDAGISVHRTSLNTTEPPDKLNQEDLDDSKLSCSTFGSPIKDEDITKHIAKENDIDKSITHENGIAKHTIHDRDVAKRITNTRNISKAVSKSIDLTIDHDYKRDSMTRVLKAQDRNRFAAEDDEVATIDSESEIIALSSDEDETVTKKKSPNMKKSSIKQSKSPKAEPSTSRYSNTKDNTMKQYLVPASYPNQGMVFVKKHVRDNELNKLNQLQEDLHNIRYLLENMDVDTLPDGGVKLLQRLSGLEAEVKRQGDKVANMVVEPEQPTANDMANDGFEKGLSWDDIQKASKLVQPRMFGKQAMTTHMAERNLILERLRNLHESLASRPPEEEHDVPPKALKTELMGHQLHALSWLRWRETQHPCGGILADDMGLGKTITMISLVLSSKEKNLDDEDDDDDEPWTGKENSKLVRGGTLVVCPASLIQQWGNEVTKHCRSHALSVCLHHGASRATQPRRLATYDLVVTTYNLLQRDSEKNGVLTRIRWTRIILDEAHIIRNHKAATSTAVSALKGQRRWCLTGTPVQNKDLDVFALLKFLRCTPFDDLAMWKKWIDNKSLGGQERLSTIMRCLLLRRTKQQLQERGQLNCLPERSLHQLTVTLSKEEMNVYQKVLVFSKTLFAQFLHQRAERQETLAGGGFLPKPPGKDDAYAKMHKKMIALQGAKPVKSHEILVLLLRLRQVCCHCGLIAAMLDDSEDVADVTEDPGSVDLLQELNKLSLEDDKKDKRKSNKLEEQEEEPAQEGTTVAEAIRSVLSPNNPVFDLKQQSSKIEAVMDCLRQNVFKNKDDKAVVVSQWTTVLHLVETELNKCGVRSVTLSGSVPVTNRPPLIAALNDPSSNVKVMLLSLCAGGVGLNLCGANHLLLLDPHWNPQLEEQAQDRIYRVGQKKPVHIYRYMCLDTVEASIRSLQQAKLQVADSVLTGARHTNASKLSIEDLKMLFNMGPQAADDDQ